MHNLTKIKNRQTCLSIKILMNSKEVITFLILLLMLLILSNNNHNTSSLRKKERSLLSNDYYDFKNMLLGGGEIKLCDKINIDLNSWTVVTPTVTKIIGNGDNSTIEIYPAVDGSVQIFEKLNNIEISNLNIEIKPTDGSNILYIRNSLIKEMNNAKLNGFHLKISGVINFQINGGDSSLISNSIYSSILNDVGITFTDMKIDNSNSEVFSLISNSVYSDNRLVYNGIYLKGKSITVKTGSGVLRNGLMFGDITNIDFNYVVIDIESISFLVYGCIYYSLFTYQTQSDVTLNNMLIIVRKSYRYEDFNDITTDSFLSMVSMHISNSLTINHSLIDIHFSDLIFNLIKTDYWGKNDHLKRLLKISSVVYFNYNYNYITTNYLHVRFFFNKDCKSNTKKCEFFTGNNCKSICEPSLVVAENQGKIDFKNSYFFIDKAFDATVEPYFIEYFNGVFINDKSYITTNGINLYDGTHSFITGDVSSIYLQMMKIGYSKFGSIIYDPVIPYYDYNSNNINYEIFENIKPKYENHCNLYPNFTTEEIIEETTTEDITLEDTKIPTTTTEEITSSIEITTIKEKPTTQTSFTIPSSTEETTTTITETTLTTEEVTTIMEIELTNEDNEESNQSKNEDNSSLMIIIVSVMSAIAVLCIGSFICYCYKTKPFMHKRVSPENSQMEYKTQTSQESEIGYVEDGREDTSVNSA